MEQYELDYIKKRAKDWRGSSRMSGLDTLDKMEQIGRANELDHIISKYEDVIVAP